MDNPLFWVTTEVFISIQNQRFCALELLPLSEQVTLLQLHTKEIILSLITTEILNVFQCLLVVELCFLLVGRTSKDRITLG